MFSANCWGVIDLRNSWSMLFSRASAAVGLRAWSHDCWKFGAFLARS
jgi:hypothetical protein